MKLRGLFSKATGRTRTGDLQITNQLLYQLSYGGESDGVDCSHISGSLDRSTVKGGTAR